MNQTAIKKIRKQCCKACPFASDVSPYLEFWRAVGMANNTCDPKGTFICHETIDHDKKGKAVVTHKSLICAGFKSMQLNNRRKKIPGFNPDPRAYKNIVEMIENYK